MAVVTHRGVGIAAISAAVPSHRVDNYTYQTALFGTEAIKSLVEKIGIYERRFAKPDVCASDLCYAAAKQLLDDNKVDTNEINLLIFISVSPDYKFPPTATLLQDRLGLGCGTIAFDITMGCSAVLYGLHVAYSMLQAPGMKKALVLIGDTNSRIYSPEDRTSAYIFGDAGTAMLIEKSEKYGESHFSINTDGACGDFIMQPAGGSRMPSSQETLESRVVDQYGNKRCAEQAWMKGGEVLQLVISHVPSDIKSLMAYAAENKDTIDYLLLHQANAYMNNYLSKKLKFETVKVPTSLPKFGNTGGASIPLTMVTELKDTLGSGTHTLLLSAFGIGMSWGSAIVKVADCRISNLVEI